MYCIVLSSIVFSSVDDFNLKFNKKQSEKQKHYEGEHFKIVDTTRDKDYAPLAEINYLDSWLKNKFIFSNELY